MVADFEDTDGSYRQCGEELLEFEIAKAHRQYVKGI